MTDEESAAFDNWAIQKYGYPAIITGQARDAWEAAVEWATKRERERCLNWIGAFSTADDLSHNMIDSITEGR